LFLFGVVPPETTAVLCSMLFSSVTIYRGEIGKRFFVNQSNSKPTLEAHQWQVGLGVGGEFELRERERENKKVSPEAMAGPHRMSFQEKITDDDVVEAGSRRRAIRRRRSRIRRILAAADWLRPRHRLRGMQFRRIPHATGCDRVGIVGSSCSILGWIASSSSWIG